jgi:hypothetical protein
MCTAGGWHSSEEKSMTTVQEAPLTLGDGSARQLANATKTTEIDALASALHALTAARHR